MFNFWGTVYCFLKWQNHIIFLSAAHKVSISSTSLPTVVTFWFSDIISLWFWFLFLRCCWTSFHVLIHLWRNTIQSFVIFLIEFFILRVLYISWVLVPYQIHVNIFSILWSLFTLHLLMHNSFLFPWCPVSFLLLPMLLVS